MSLDGIARAARTLAFYTRLQDVVANNLANANTAGFKADRLTAFLGNGESPVPVRGLDLVQGELHETGRPLDLALDGEGFLVLDTPAGERLVRGGSFRLDAAGRLTDFHDNPVLGDEGPIVVTSGTLEVQTDGTILVDGAAMARLRVVLPQDVQALQKEAGGKLVPAGPLDPGPARIRQGVLEEANVDPLRSMVDLLTIQRAFAANMDALKTMDGVLGSVTNTVGQL